MLWIRPLMPRLSEKLFLLAALTALSTLGGCCTMFNCEPGTCPDDESLCVEFGATRDMAEQCQSLASPSPYARSFCMQTCDENSDCRSGYTCADLSSLPNAWDAVLIDKGRGNKACVVPFDGGPEATTPGGAVGDVCVSKPSEPEPTTPEPVPTEPGEGNQGGSG